ncbi:MAG TPA: hypothetical protein VGC79_18130, partial [Polyangiaceae bacterium]
MKSSFPFSGFCALGTAALGALVTFGVAACQTQHSEPRPAESPQGANAAASVPPPSGAPGPPAKAELALEDEVLATFFEDDIPRSSGGYTYSYGGKTKSEILPNASAGNGAFLGVFFDDDYSGVNISFGGKFIDLRPYRKTGSLSFWIKGGPAAQKFMVGLMDNQGSGIKAQSKVSGDSYTTVQQGQWLHCRIPLKAFTDDGAYWDESQHREIAAKMDWSKIQDFRISINRGDNKVDPGQPVVFYLDQIQLTKTAKGIADPDAYWDAFDSKAPPQLLTDFTKWSELWHAQHGDSAEIQVAVGAPPKGAPPALKGQALKVTFKPGDWSDAYILPANAAGMPRDWSKHWGLLLWLYTDKPYQAFDLTIRDRDQELFVSKAGATRGWHQVLVPFR